MFRKELFLFKQRHRNLLLSNIVPNQEATQSVSRCDSILFVYVYAISYVDSNYLITIVNLPKLRNYYRSPVNISFPVSFQ